MAESEVTFVFSYNYLCESFFVYLLESVYGYS